MALQDDNITGIITVTTAGTKVTGPAVQSSNGFMIKAHPDNTDTVWVMSGNKTKTSGFPLNVGEQTVLRVPGLNMVAFDADVNGEKICWIML